MMRGPIAALTVLAGLAGAAGVALSAMAAHRVNDPALATAAPLLIMHAAAAVALVARAERAARPGLWLLAAGLLLAGATLFAGDITLRAFTGARLFPYAAPMGGSTMIAGWLAVVLAAIAQLRAAQK